jgi:hypothetical protein
MRGILHYVEWHEQIRNFMNTSHRQLESHDDYKNVYNKHNWQLNEAH